MNNDESMFATGTGTDFPTPAPTFGPAPVAETAPGAGGTVFGTVTLTPPEISQFAESFSDEAATLYARFAASSLVRRLLGNFVPSSTEKPQISVVVLVLDDSISVASQVPTILKGHDHLVRQLHAEVNKDTLVLVAAVTINGRVLYSFRPVEDAPTLVGTEAEFTRQLKRITPLMTILVNVLAAVAEIVLLFETANKNVVYTVAGVTDGENNREQVEEDDLRTLIQEAIDTENIIMLMYIGEMIKAARIEAAWERWGVPAVHRLMVGNEVTKVTAGFAIMSDVALEQSQVDS